MKSFFRILFYATVILFAATAKAQNSSLVQLSYTQQRLNENEVVLTIQAIVPPSTKLYTLQQNEATALYSSIDFDSTIISKLDGGVVQSGSIHTTTDNSVKSKVWFVDDSVTWQQKIKAIANDSLIIKGNVNLLYNHNGKYLSDEKLFKIYIEPAKNIIETSVDPGGVANGKSLLWIFFTAFAGGLLALLTPCIYSMIPITVSFFTKRSKTKQQGIKNALSYSASIIIIFTVFGFLITLLFGPAALNNLATNWIANLIFFVVFVLFGISFLGAFEITLPSSWSTKVDTKAGISNFGGIFFMALTLVLVSFSCTGPIIGNLLVLAAKGNFYGPLIGMLGFSMALALPFALFAFFPSRLHVLGQAGGWLNAIKVTLGFLELALAMKFLSNADLSKGWRLLDREIFLSVWIGIFLALGFYLFGLIKFKHDDALPKNDFGVPHLSVPRVFFAITVFGFVFYMIPGLVGAPLKGISAFLPPMGTQDYTGISSTNSAPDFTSTNNSNNAPLNPVQFVEQMSIYEPEVVKKSGMKTFYDYKEALQVARLLHKPLMLDFTGINCVNCRRMEAEVWSDDSVMQQLKNNFVIVSLYVDARNIELPQQEQFYSKALEKQVENLGDKNADMQVTKFGANTQPYYFFIDDDEQKLVNDGYGYDPDVKKFSALLTQVKNKFDKKQNEQIAANY